MRNNVENENEEEQRLMEDNDTKGNTKPDLAVNIPTPVEPVHSSAPKSINGMKGFLVACTYGCISLGIFFFNKLTLQLFNRPMFLNMLQLLSTIIILPILKKRGLIELADLEMKKLITFAPVSVVSLFNVLSGLLATHALTTSMFSILRRVSTLFTISAELFFLGVKPNPADVTSVVFWVSGAALSSWGDLYFTAAGYSAAAFNCAATALYLVLVKRVNRDANFSSFSLLYYNSILSLPLQVMLFLVSDEPQGALSDPNWGNISFWALFLVTLSLGPILNYSIFYCIKVNSPTATSITGQIKSVVQSLIGILFLHTAVNTSGCIGLTVSTMGCVYYIYNKLHPVQEKQLVTPVELKSPGGDRGFNPASPKASSD